MPYANLTTIQPDDSATVTLPSGRALLIEYLDGEACGFHISGYAKLSDIAHDNADKRAGREPTRAAFYAFLSTDEAGK